MELSYVKGDFTMALYHDIWHSYEMKNRIQVEISLKKVMQFTHRFAIQPSFLCSACDARRVAQDQKENIWSC